MGLTCISVIGCDYVPFIYPSDRASYRQRYSLLLDVTLDRKILIPTASQDRKRSSSRHRSSVSSLAASLIITNRSVESRPSSQQPAAAAAAAAAAVAAGWVITVNLHNSDSLTIGDIPPSSPKVTHKNSELSVSAPSRMNYTYRQAARH